MTAGYVDHNISSVIVDRLREGGHDMVSVGELRLAQATDDEILFLAAEARKLLITNNV